MSIIRKCEYCLSEVNDKRTYRKQTEVYDAIGIDVPMCWNCGEAALFERKRIIKLLESLKGTCDNDCDDCRPYADKNDHYLNEVIALIRGKNK